MQTTAPGDSAKARPFYENQPVTANNVDLRLQIDGQAQEALRVTHERFNSGRETINDVLAAEATLRDRRARLAIAKVNVARAHVQLARAAGLSR